MGHQYVMELTHAAMELRQVCVGSGALTIQANKKTPGRPGTILVYR